MLGTFALSDPRGASPTVGEKQADGSFLLNGRKSFVTAGPHAEHVIVLAMTTSDPDKPRHTALIVRRGEPGYSSAPPDEKMGLRAAHASTLVFENVRVPATHVLGGEGAGLDVAAFAIDGIRIGIAAQAVGIARAAFERAAAHAREGKANQATQFMISDMAVDIDAARLLALRAARLRDRSVPHTAESSMAKLFASEMATRVTHRAMQIFGGLGYTAGGGVERQYRDARITEIDEGTSEIQRNIIAAAVLER
jgi:butyryl-CoA dehydrogenase